MTQATEFRVSGRLVQGDLYEGNDKDQAGNPRVVKTGPNKGQTTKVWFFALAVKKGPEPHWAHTEWGKIIWAMGHGSFPNGQANAPTFAWKVEDGDSQVPNKRGRKNVETEGMPGNWIINFSSSFPVKVCNAQGDPILEPGAVKLGYYVGVLGSVAGNGQSDNAGVYVNHLGVALLGYGKEIVKGRNLKGAFDGMSAPEGALSAPVGGFPGGSPTPPGGSTPPPPGGTPPAASASPPPPGAPAAGGSPPPPPATPVTPSAAFVGGHGAPPPPGGAPTAPPPPAGPVMLPAANGIPYASFIANKWTDAQLRAAGYMA